MSDDNMVLQILHKIQDRLAILDRKVTVQTRDLAEVRKDVRVIRATFHAMSDDEVTVLHQDVDRVLERMRDLEVRVENLEGSAVSPD